MAKPLNLQKLAQTITEQEGGKKNMSIAQVKEVVGLTLALLNDLVEDEGDGGVEVLLSTLKRAGANRRKRQKKAENLI